MNFLAGFGMMQSLGVGINSHKIDPCNSRFNHPVDGRATGTADPYYFNTGKCLDGWLYLGHI